MKLLALILSVYFVLPTSSFADDAPPASAPAMVCKSKSYWLIVHNQKNGEYKYVGEFYLNGKLSSWDMIIQGAIQGDGSAAYDLDDYPNLIISKDELQKTNLHKCN